MMALFHAHSGLRFLVLLVGVLSVVAFAAGLASGRPAGKWVRVAGAVFVSLVDLQILIGLTMVAMGRWYPQLAGHLVLMLAAAGLAHTTLVLNRRRSSPGFVLPLLGVGGALALIALGILAINRGVLTMTLPLTST